MKKDWKLRIVQSEDGVKVITQKGSKGYSYKKTLKFKRSEIERNATKTNIRW